MQRMRKEVPPLLGVALILIALAAAQLLYWRALMTEKKLLSPGGGGGGGTGAKADLPGGLPDVTVDTAAGQGDPGYRDGSALNALFDGPAALALAPDGAVYVADSRNHVIRMVSSGGQVSTVAGGPGEPGCADGSRAEARFSAPAGVVVGRDGSLFVADTGNHRIRRIDRDGTVCTYAGTMTPTDDLGREVGGYLDGPAAQAQFRYPVGLAIDPAGSVYVADAGNRCVRRISPGGEVATLAVKGKDSLQSPTGVCLTSDGRIWVADTSGHRLWNGLKGRPLAPWPGNATDAGKGFAPAGIAALREASSQECVYVADSAAGGLWRIDSGRLTLIAGRPEAGVSFQDGAGDVAAFNCPAGLASGAASALYVADFGNQRIRRVTLPPAAKEKD